MNLLDHFALVRTQIVRLHAELLQPVAANNEIQAQVEIKISPSTIPGSDSAQPEYQIGCRISCTGMLQGDNKDAVFKLECVLNAMYKQVEGEAIDFDVFSKLHHSLNRQIYPLAHQNLGLLMAQIGLAHIRLPSDLFHSHKSVSISTVAEPTRQVH